MEHGSLSQLGFPHAVCHGQYPAQYANGVNILFNVSMWTKLSFSSFTPYFLVKYTNPSIISVVNFSIRTNKVRLCVRHRESSKWASSGADSNAAVRAWLERSRQWVEIGLIYTWAPNHYPHHYSLYRDNKTRYMTYNRLLIDITRVIDSMNCSQLLLSVFVRYYLFIYANAENELLLFKLFEKF